MGLKPLGESLSKSDGDYRWELQVLLKSKFPCLPLCFLIFLLVLKRKRSGLGESGQGRKGNPCHHQVPFLPDVTRGAIPYFLAGPLIPISPEKPGSDSSVPRGRALPENSVPSLPIAVYYRDTSVFPARSLLRGAWGGAVQQGALRWGEARAAGRLRPRRYISAATRPRCRRSVPPAGRGREGVGGRRRRRGERTTGAGEHRVSAVGGQRGRAAWAPLRSPSPPPRWGCPFCGLLLRWGGVGGWRHEAFGRWGGEASPELSSGG